MCTIYRKAKTIRAYKIYVLYLLKTRIDFHSLDLIGYVASFLGDSEVANLQ